MLCLLALWCKQYSKLLFYKVDKWKLKLFVLLFSFLYYRVLQMKADEKVDLSDENTASCPLSPVKMCLNHPVEWNLTAASLASCTVNNQNLKHEEK